MKVLRQAFIDSESALIGSNMQIGDHCKMQNGRPFPGDQYCDDGVLLLRPGNIGEAGYVDWAEKKTKRVPHRYLSEAADFVLTQGDVVINLTAQSLEDGFMGRVCFVNSDEPSLLNQRVGRFRGFSERLRPEFLLRCLQSSRFKAHAVSMCEGSKIKHLFWEHLAKFQLPQLDPEQQDAACAGAMQIDRQIEHVGRRLTQTKGVKFHLLQSVGN
jgi:type I restriction enzyme S subunit